MIISPFWRNGPNRSEIELGVFHPIGLTYTATSIPPPPASLNVL